MCFTCRTSILTVLDQLGSLAGKPIGSNLEAVLQQADARTIGEDGRSGGPLQVAIEAIAAVLALKRKNLRKAFESAAGPCPDDVDMDSFSLEQLQLVSLIGYVMSALNALFSNACIQDEDRKALVERMLRSETVEVAAVAATCALLGGARDEGYVEVLGDLAMDRDGTVVTFCQACSDAALLAGFDVANRKSQFAQFKRDHLTALYGGEATGNHGYESGCRLCWTCGKPTLKRGRGNYAVAAGLPCIAAQTVSIKIGRCINDCVSTVAS